MRKVESIELIDQSSKPPTPPAVLLDDSVAVAEPQALTILGKAEKGNDLVGRAGTYDSTPKKISRAGGVRPIPLFPDSVSNVVTRLAANVRNQHPHGPFTD